ncbi:PAS domain S-box protein [Halalkalibacter urbisdiaboli]|uniref:PAS domain S-box protein n=1 Tax=Halalkalibacter urbisdiaboli TaxID=1960589 RepID=UPI000B43CF45|nr:PAS domain S-box protein [Halalkalibacter urbisdiaboli]
MNVKKLDSFEILDKITDGFYILDANWNFIYMNNAAETILNRSKEELLGRSIWNEFSDAVDLPIYDHYHSALKKKQSVNFEFYYPSMKQWFNVRAYPSNEGLSAYFLDITAAKNQSLSREQHYQSLFLNNPDAVFLFDITGKFISGNHALEVLTGYGIDELLNISFEPLIIEEDLEKTVYHFNETKMGIPQNYETRFYHKSGQVLHCSVTNIPIILDGQISGVYGISKDITFQKKAEKLIENAEKLSLVGQLSASIAHEIRNPLTTLKGFLQLSKTERAMSEKYIDIMLSEMNRIELITSELLYLAKPQAMHFTYSNIEDILDDVVHLFQSQALIKNITLIYEPIKEIGSIYCVANQLKQVFINLLKNAFESMPEGGDIKVSLENFDEEQVLIKIIDQGCGISDEIAPKIGLPFYSTKEKGTGLGMGTTYKIIHEHGGKITFDSAQGKGTTFRIFLPKHPPKSGGK